MTYQRRAKARMKQARRAVPAAKASFINFGDWWIAGGDLNGSSSGLITYPDTSMGRLMAAKYNVWASNCIAARAETLASVDIKLYRKATEPDAEDELVEDHPIVDLLEKVNSINLNRRSFVEQMERQLSIHGEVYIHKVRRAPGAEPLELFILPAQLVEPLPDSKRLVSQFRYNGTIGLPVDDVIRIYYPEDADPLYARSPMSAAIMPINNYQLADIAQEGIDRRGGQGGGIVTTDFNEIDGEPERFMTQWDAQRSDPRNAGRDAFLPLGSTYNAGTLTAQQQQREERMQRLIKSIMAAFRVPPSLAGDYKDASVLANAAQQSTNFWETFALFELKRISDALTYDLLWREFEGSEDEGMYLAFDVSTVRALQEGEDAKAARYSTTVAAADGAYNGGMISLNEARMKIGEQPIDDPRAEDVLMPASPEEMDLTGEDMPEEDVTAEDEDIASEVEGLISEADAIKALARDYARDSSGQFADVPGSAGGGGKVGDNAIRRAVGGLASATATRKKGKAKKKKLTDAEKQAKKEAKAAERKAKRLEALGSDLSKLEDALQKMQGKEDPSNLRKRIGKAIERLKQRIDAVKNNTRASYADALVSEMNSIHGTKAMPFDKGQFVWAGFYLNTNDARAIEATPLDLDVSKAKLEDRHHVTLYLMPLELFRPLDEPLLVAAVLKRVASLPGFKMQIAGTGVFTNGDTNVVYAAPDAIELAHWYQCMREAWAEAGYGEYVPEHGFTPHITLAYVEPGTDTSKVSVPNIPVTASAFTLSFGNKVYTIPLMGGMSTVQNMPEATKATVKYFDPVGKVALFEDGTRGNIEAVKRFGDFDGLKATAEAPVFIIDGKAHPADTVSIEL